MLGCCTNRTCCHVVSCVRCTLNGFALYPPGRVPRAGSGSARVRLSDSQRPSRLGPLPRSERLEGEQMCVSSALYGKACVGGRRRPGGGATKMPRNVSCEQNPPSITARTSNDSYVLDTTMTFVASPRIRIACGSQARKAARVGTCGGIATGSCVA